MVGSFPPSITQLAPVTFAVLTAILGPHVHAGAIDQTHHDHYGLERTLATGLGVPPLAHARAAAPFTSIWH